MRENGREGSREEDQPISGRQRLYGRTGSFAFGKAQTDPAGEGEGETRAAINIRSDAALELAFPRFPTLGVR